MHFCVSTYYDNYVCFVERSGLEKSNCNKHNNKHNSRSREYLGA